jgi:hypothetical protein
MEYVISTPGLDRMVRELSKKGMAWRNTRNAIQRISELSIQNWKTKANNPKENHAKWFGRQYASSITIKEKKFSDTEMRIVIGPSGKGIKSAEVIENGRGEYDMKPSLLASPRARRSKRGKVYTIVGFRHGMKTVISAGVSESFDKLKSYNKVGSKLELNAHGKTVSRNVYSMSSEGFGSRLGKVKDKSGNAGHLSGLMKTTQKIGKSRGKSQSQAITFRVVTAGQSGWKFPKISGQKISKEIYNEYKENGSELIRNAVKVDLLKFISGDKKL